MSGSFKAKTVSALSWSLIQEFSQRGLQLAIGILLARLLGPKEFGLVAMLAIFFAVAQSLVESGFGSALIQRKELTIADECSVFYFNVFAGLCLACFLCLVAPLIAGFYHQNLLTSLTRVWSVVLVINSFGVVQSALMVRELNFKGQAVISVMSTGVSGAVGLSLAWGGWGVWSLVWQQITFSSVRAGLLWLLNAWRPRWLFSFPSLREMFGFGSGMVAASLVDTLFDNLYSVAIGKLYTPVTLGFYNRAYTFQDIASRLLSAIANRVTFPVFSQLQHDSARLKRGLQKAMTTLAFAQFPLMIGLAVVARPMVLLLLGEKWEPCIPYLQLLCFAGLFYPMHLLNLNVLMARGRSDLFFRLVLIRRALVVVNIVTTFRWGVLAMVWGQVIISVVSYFVNSYYTKRFADYSIPEQLRDVCPYLTASIVMGIVVALVNLPLPAGHVAQFSLKVCTGAIVYWAICCGFHLPALGEIMAIIRRRTAVPA
jgi:O-antigen/teichoic acid export membrane protein